ncbi:Carboxypeptidase Y [Spathaspora sp. JA1]|nr:Carboxypeptidase Y [Spathaspora sp. JA1]
MKFSTAATAALAMASVNALTLPNPLASLQQTLKLDTSYDASNIMQFLKDMTTQAIPEETKKLWTEMVLKFPDTVSKLSFQGPPAKKLREVSSNFIHVLDKAFPDHGLRIKSTPESLGIDTVKQYSGYLDVKDEDKHFFYYFFESRNDPANDPIILWLNGGPGCSSMTGLFFELGPASINAELKPVHNPHSWNNNASVIFLDQPINVGYSYSSQSVSNTIAAGKDVYAFLELFFKHFPQYSKLPFHIAGESYGGHYIPVFATEILSHKDRSFNLSSVLIGNGLTDPLVQYEYYEPMACGEGGEPSVLSPEECQAMNNSIPRCTSLIKSCYESESVWSCVPATIYCNNAQMGPYQRTGRNVYDIRTMCEGSSLCYSQLEYIDQFLNKPEVMEALGAEVEKFESCNFDINRNFMFAGDWMKPYHTRVADLLDADLPVLIYAGDKDFICNWLGNQAWTNELEYKNSKGFSKAEVKKWKVDGKAAGEVKNFENFTFLRIYGGGHMVPFDQPENSLAMVNGWINGDYALA